MTRTRYFLRRYMPTNILLDAIRTRRGLRWGVPAMALAIPYLYAASICAQLAENGGPGWLNLLVLLFIWNAMKFTLTGPVSLILLLRARARDHVAHREPCCGEQPAVVEETKADERRYDEHKFSV